jgi:nickel-type superoxide dismutase maturation protease
MRVVGYSMEPTLKNNQTIFVSSIPFFFVKPSVGNVIALSYGRCMIKRIAKINKDKIFVIGDNEKESTDSRNFGWISMKNILGKVVYKI